MLLVLSWDKRNFRKSKVKYPRILTSSKINKVKCKRNKMPRRQDSTEVSVLKAHKYQEGRNKESQLQGHY